MFESGAEGAQQYILECAIKFSAVGAAAHGQRRRNWYRMRGLRSQVRAPPIRALSLSSQSSLSSISDALYELSYRSLDGLANLASSVGDSFARRN